MVVALGPGRFYGSALPRPRFYTDVKFNSDRVDPPAPVLDPFLSWAHDAHWSMGGLSFERRRLQGRIEGSVKKLRAHLEKAQKRSPPPATGKGLKAGPSRPRVAGHKPSGRLGSLDSDSDEISEEEMESKVVGSPREKKRVRRLAEDFDRAVADKGTGVKGGVEGIAVRTRSQKKSSQAEEVEMGGEESRGDGGEKGSGGKRKRKVVNSEVPRRTSPRKKQIV